MILQKLLMCQICSDPDKSGQVGRMVGFTNPFRIGIIFSESNDFFFTRLFFCFLLSLPLFTFISYSQLGTWVAVYGGNDYDRGSGILQTYDKGYAVCGTTSSYGAGNTDIYLLKIDSSGKFQWHTTFGGNNNEKGFSIQQTSDSGFVLCGFTNSSGNGGYDAYLLKTDSLGNLQWEKTFGGTDWEFAYWAEQTIDGGFILAGETFSFGNNNQMYLVKTDSNGILQWEKIFGSQNQATAKEVHQTSDKGFIAAGYTQTDGGDFDFYLVKTDSNGILQWEKTFGTPADEQCHSVALCADGGFLLGGFRNTDDDENKTFFLKTDSEGTVLLSTTEMSAQGNRSISRIRETSDGEYILLQNTDVGGMGGQEIRLDKYNTGGWWLWGRSFGGLKDDEGFGLIQAADSGFALVGYTESYGDGPDNIFIAKTDSSGVYDNTVNSYVSVNELLYGNNNIKIFPNPSNGIFHISGISFSEIRVYNLTGKKVYQSQNPKINISFLPDGIYILEIYSKKETIRKKNILAKITSF